MPNLAYLESGITEPASHVRLRFRPELRTRRSNEK